MHHDASIVKGSAGSRCRATARVGLNLLLLVLVGCTHTTIPLTHISVPVPRLSVDMDPFMEIFGSYREGNFRNRSWTDAFQAMHQKMSREYPFTEWKAIDWEALYDAWYPLVEAAEDEGDARAYYLALRAYIHSIPDGYLHITAPDAYRDEAIGGDFGFALLPLDDGRLIVAHVREDSIAALSGIKWGAEIIEWNGMPAREALEQTSLLWSTHPAATREYALYEKSMLMTRAPVGTEVTLMFQNRDEEDAWITRIEARPDRYAGMTDLMRRDKPFSEFESPIESSMLEGNIGYVKVYCQAPTLVTPFPERLFRRTIERFVRDDVQGIVLDLRGNVGGMDDLAAVFAGHFTNTPLFFHDVVAFDSDKGGFAYLESERLDVEPRAPYFSGPLAILVHRNTRDSAQAMAAVLQPLDKVFSVGALAAEGSYAYESMGYIQMPEGHHIYYPTGRMLDEDGNILVTSGVDRESRVNPEMRLPMTLEKLDAYFNHGGDPVLEAAVAEIKARAEQS